jgi:glycerophosphoryl diester phosphodiesterase
VDIVEDFIKIFLKIAPHFLIILIKNTRSSPIILELDIRESLNGSLFILHDTTLERTTTATGLLKKSSDSLLSKTFLKIVKVILQKYLSHLR